MAGDAKFEFRHVAFVVTAKLEPGDFWNDNWQTEPWNEATDKFRCSIDGNDDRVLFENQFVNEAGSGTHILSAWYAGAATRIGREDRIYVRATPDLKILDDDGTLIDEFRFRVFDVLSVSRDETNRKVVDISVRERIPSYSKARKAWYDPEVDIAGIYRDEPSISGGIKSIRVDGGGSGYNSANPPAVTISGGGGGGASARAVVDNGKISRIELVNKGTKFTEPPTITIDDPVSGTTATATAELEIFVDGSVFKGSEPQEVFRPMFPPQQDNALYV